MRRIRSAAALVSMLGLVLGALTSGARVARAQQSDIPKLETEKYTLITTSVAMPWPPLDQAIASSTRESCSA